MYWLIAYLFEFLIFVPALWRYRKLMAPIVIAAIVLAQIMIFGSGTSLLYIGFSILSIFRIINLSRIIKNRMHYKHMYKVSLRTSAFMLGYHLPLYALSYIGGLTTLRSLQLLQIVLAAAALLMVMKNVAKLSFKDPLNKIADRDLPTVTVAIPARNETRHLEDCLTELLANDYPKLEIIVLDDCSQTKTSEIIKSFAHAGVRFIKGADIQEGWLAKNQAYEHLYQQASGRLILFCGVDTRFGKNAIKSMVNLMHDRQKNMLSVLPFRVAGEPGVTLLQPMRYWWELALPRKLLSRPAVLSTCWLISKQSLKKFGGFGAVKNSIMPESYFARELVKLDDSYSFVRSSENLEVHTKKTFIEQRSSSLRLRYPQARKRLEVLLLVLVAQLLLFALPITLIALGLFAEVVSMPLSLIGLGLVLVTHVMILQITNPANIFMALLTFPLAVATEISMGLISMYQYEFSIIEWKDRNICLPVMKVYKSLPRN
jgi:hypothetical protein